MVVLAGGRAGGRRSIDQGPYRHLFSEANGGHGVEMGDGIMEVIAFSSLTHLCLAMGCKLKAVVLGQVGGWVLVGGWVESEDTGLLRCCRGALRGGCARDVGRQRSATGRRARSW